MSKRFHISSIQGAFSAVVFSVLVTGPALAHSFDVDIVFSQSTAAALRNDFLAAFRRASAERDSHANEESDGHLGGLDVYSKVKVLGSGDAEVTGTFIVVADADCAAVAADQVGIVIDAAQAAGMADAAGYRSDYENRYGALPSELVLSGYLVARQIDAVVRPLGGVGDVAALREAVPGLCN